jgi:hypothetical protein
MKSLTGEVTAHIGSLGYRVIEALVIHFLQLALGIGYCPLIIEK